MWLDRMALKNEYLRQLIDYRLECVSQLAGTRGYLMATDTQVLVVGAGPVGLVRAAEVNRHGVSCRIVDKNDGPTHASRAASIQARTLEILDSVILANEFVQVGNICHAAATYSSDHKLIKYLTFDELDSAFSFVLQLPQSQTERMVARYLTRLGTEVERHVELVAFEQDEDGVRATLQPADGGQETAHVSYLIACDGAHSPVRHALGVSFSGDDYPTDFMMADVQVDWKLPRDQLAFFFAAEGMFAFFPLPRGRATVAADIGPAQGHHPPLGEPALEDLQAIFNIRTPGWRAEGSHLEGVLPCPLPSSGTISGGPRLSGWGCRSCQLQYWWPGYEHRYAGCIQSRLETRTRAKRQIPSKPSR